MYTHRKCRLISLDNWPLGKLLDGYCYAVDEAVDPGYRYGLSSITYAAFLLTLSGCSDYRINREAVRIEPGSLLLLTPGISFSEQVPGPDPCHNRYVMLEGPLVTDLCKALLLPSGYRYLEACPPELERALGAVIERVHASCNPDPLLLAAELLELAGVARSSLSGEPAAPALKRRIEKAVSEDPSADWPVARLAEVCGMGESSFAHRFRKETGDTPAAVARRVRCDLARELLFEGLSVAEVAGRLGFQNPFHFSRVFKQVTGLPPSRVQRTTFRRPRRTGS